MNDSEREPKAPARFLRSTRLHTLNQRLWPVKTSYAEAILASLRSVVCASPGYFVQHARPRVPGDLAGHQCITFPSAGSPAHWPFKMPSGKIQNLSVRSRLTLNTIEGNVDAALQDGGLVNLYSYQAAAHVADGTLEIVLESHEIDPTPVSIVYPHGKRVPQKTRAFVDFAMPRLRKTLALIETQCAPT